MLQGTKFDIDDEKRNSGTNRADRRRQQRWSTNLLDGGAGNAGLRNSVR